MLKSAPSSQPAYVVNGAATSGDGRWNQVDSNNMLSIAPPNPNPLPPPSAVSAPISNHNVFSEHHDTNSFNNVNIQQAVYPPNHMNMTYPSPNVPNGYLTLNPAPINMPQIMINGQNLQTPQMPGVPEWSIQLAHGGYVSQPPAGSNNKKTGGIKKPKRIRTAFTTQQITALEQQYAINHFLDRPRRIEMANGLLLNERTIKIWFQNRRMKEKKDKAEAMQEEISTSESSSELNSCCQMTPMLTNQQYLGGQSNLYNHGNIYVDQCPGVSAPVPIPGPSFHVAIPGTSSSTSLPTNYLLNSMPASSLSTSMAVQNSSSHHNLLLTEENQAQYQQVPMQLQSLESHSEVSDIELSPEVEPEAAPYPASAQSNCDVSWINEIMDYEENF